ncbi:MAG: Abi family protein [Clostridia bacterium]|nr:Abi family protein [Clostridia bacterium]
MADVKEFLTYEEQLEHLKGAGLHIENDDVAKYILSKVNYYRLINAYSLGLYAEREPHDKYKPGITFYQIYDLYKFDLSLRHIMSELLEEFEILFRTKLAYYIGEKYGPLGYLDSLIFKNEEYHNSFIEDLNREKVRQKNSPIIKHHNAHYDGNLPIWVLVEVVSFGVISKLYSNMKLEDQKNIAKEIGLKPKYLKSWLRSFVEIRNVCAHYGRLYNKILISPPQLYNDVDFDNTRIFAVLYVLKRFASERLWTTQLVDLKLAITEHKSIELSKIGFPENWEKLLGFPI